VGTALVLREQWATHSETQLPILFQASPFNKKSGAEHRQTFLLKPKGRRQWWSRQRTVEGINTMLAASSAVVGLIDDDDDGDGTLVAFGRALSDGIYRATIYDLMVDEGYQGSGLGRQLMDSILIHPALAKVARIELACLPELVPFYEKWGLEVVPLEWKQMVKGKSE
jgi:GNAT superfamily N-acetyltransferase